MAKDKMWMPLSIRSHDKTEAMEVPNGILFRYNIYDGGVGTASNVAMCFVPAPRGYLKKWLAEEEKE